MPCASLLFMKRAYTALCNTSDRDQDLVTAVRWALDQAQEDQSVTLWCWDKESLPADVVAAAPSLGIRIRSEKPRPQGGRYVRAPDGPVVAVDVPLETLVEIEPFGHPACLVHAYVPENDKRGGRIAPPGELAETVQYLASSGAGFVTGQIVTVDGGRGVLDAVQVPAY